VNDAEPTLMQRLAWLLLVVVIAGLIGAAFWRKMHPKELDLSGQHRIVPGSNAPKPEDLAVLGEVKSFSLVDQHGKPVQAKDLLGEVWVANFVFTRCAGTCPLMTRAMSDLDKQLADLPSVKLVTFSMDPEFDTPDVLSKYAFKSDASPRWLFLSGDKTEMYRVTQKEFQLVVRDDAGTKDEPIIHSTKFILLDAQGKIRGRFDGLAQGGTNEESIKLLASSVRKLRSMPLVGAETAPAPPNGRK
jgi:cytochrome oxidase Cu insertion factor (SCO1/SenC/PrrC family)